MKNYEVTKEEYAFLRLHYGGRIFFRTDKGKYFVRAHAGYENTLKKTGVKLIPVED